MTTEASNHYKFQVNSGNIDHDTDTFIIILMNTGFTFNKDTHATYANVLGDELADLGYGYSQKTKALVLSSVTENDTDDRSDAIYDNAAWVAAGGSIGPSPGACIIADDTADDTVVGYIDFGGEQTASDGGTFTVAGIIVRKA